MRVFDERLFTEEREGKPESVKHILAVSKSDKQCPSLGSITIFCRALSKLRSNRSLRIDPQGLRLVWLLTDSS